MTSKEISILYRHWNSSIFIFTSWRKSSNLQTPLKKSYWNNPQNCFSNSYGSFPKKLICIQTLISIKNKLERTKKSNKKVNIFYLFIVKRFSQTPLKTCLINQKFNSLPYAPPVNSTAPTKTSSVCSTKSSVPWMMSGTVCPSFIRGGGKICCWIRKRIWRCQFRQLKNPKMSLKILEKMIVKRKLKKLKKLKISEFNLIKYDSDNEYRLHYSFNLKKTNFSIFSWNNQ